VISAGRLQDWLARGRRGAQPKNVTLTRIGSLPRIGGIFLPGEGSFRVLLAKLSSKTRSCAFSSVIVSPGMPSRSGRGIVFPTDWCYVARSTCLCVS
jgi:hypothetical protein